MCTNHILIILTASDIWIVVAIHAGVERRALHVLRLVLLASHVRNAVLIHPAVCRV